MAILYGISPSLSTADLNFLDDKSRSPAVGAAFSPSGRVQCRDPRHLLGQVALGVPEIVRPLHAQPEARSQHAMQHLAGHAEGLGRLGDTKFERRQNVLAQDRAGMDGRAVGVSCDHGGLPLGLGGGN